MRITILLLLSILLVSCGQMQEDTMLPHTQKEENILDKLDTPKVYEWKEYKRKDWEFGLGYFPKGYDKCLFRMEKIERNSTPLIGFKNGKRVYGSNISYIYTISNGLYNDTVVANCNGTYFINEFSADDSSKEYAMIPTVYEE